MVYKLDLNKSFKRSHDFFFNLNNSRNRTINLWRPVSESSESIESSIDDILICTNYDNSKLITEKNRFVKWKNDNSDKDFPILLPNNKELVKKYAGKYIGIVENELVAVDTDIRKLKEKAKKIMKEGQRCYIEYIDGGVSIYGIEV